MAPAPKTKTTTKKAADEAPPASKAPAKTKAKAAAPPAKTKAAKAEDVHAEAEGKSRTSLNKVLGLRVPPTRVLKHVRSIFGDEEDGASLRVGNGAQVAVATAVEYVLESCVKFAFAQAANADPARSIIRVADLHTEAAQGEIWQAFLHSLPSYAGYTAEAEAEQARLHAEASKAKEAASKAQKAFEAGEGTEAAATAAREAAAAAAEAEGAENPYNFRQAVGEIIDAVKSADAAEKKPRVEARFRRVLSDCAQELTARLATHAKIMLGMLLSSGTFKAKHVGPILAMVLTENRLAETEEAQALQEAVSQKCAEFDEHMKKKDEDKKHRRAEKEKEALASMSEAERAEYLKKKEEEDLVREFKKKAGSIESRRKQAQALLENIEAGEKDVAGLKSGVESLLKKGGLPEEERQSLTEVLGQA